MGRNLIREGQDALESASTADDASQLAKLGAEITEVVLRAGDEGYTNQFVDELEEVRSNLWNKFNELTDSEGLADEDGE